MVSLDLDECVKMGTGKILMYCHAGCDITEKCDALEISLRDLFE